MTAKEKKELDEKYNPKFNWSVSFWRDGHHIGTITVEGKTCAQLGEWADTCKVNSKADEYFANVRQ